MGYIVFAPGILPLSHDLQGRGVEGAACCGLVAEDHDEIRGTCTNEAGNKSNRSTAKLLQQNRPYPAARQIFRTKKSTRPHFLILRRQLLRILFRRPTRLKSHAAQSLHAYGPVGHSRHHICFSEMRYPGPASRATCKVTGIESAGGCVEGSRSHGLQSTHHGQRLVSRRLCFWNTGRWKHHCKCHHV